MELELLLGICMTKRIPSCPMERHQHLHECFAVCRTLRRHAASQAGPSSLQHVGSVTMEVPTPLSGYGVEGLMFRILHLFQCNVFHKLMDQVGMRCSNTMFRSFVRASACRKVPQAANESKRGLNLGSFRFSSGFFGLGFGGRFEMRL